MEDSRDQYVSRGLIEDMAEAEHARWAHWMKYLFTQGKFMSDGSFLINRENVEKWKRQMTTEYSELTEREMEADRKEVRGTLRAMGLIE